MDVLDRIQAIGRTVTSTEREGKPARTVTARKTYAAGAAEVWDAVTNPERLPRWFAAVTGDLRVGGHYAIEGNASGVVEACAEPERLALTWEFGGETSWLELTVTPDGDRTVLTLAHTAVVDGDRWAQFGPGAVGVGWDLTLLGLGMHLDSGAGMAPDEAQAWAVSSEGLSFMTGSSEAWRDAAVAGGDDPEAAGAAAARTTAFYTGAPEV